MIFSDKWLFGQIWGKKDPKTPPFYVLPLPVDFLFIYHMEVV